MKVQLEEVESIEAPAEGETEDNCDPKKTKAIRITIDIAQEWEHQTSLAVQVC